MITLLRCGDYMKLDNKYIGIRILQKRKENGLSQEELSEKIGISKNHLSSIERLTIKSQV